MVSKPNSVCLAGGGTLKIWQQFLSCLFRFTFWIRRRIWRWRSWGFSFSFRLFLCILFWLLLLDCFFGRFWSRRFWTWARSTFLFNNSRMHIKIPDNSSVGGYRFWAGETCFEDFDGFESLDLDLPLRTDSDFLKINFEIFIFSKKSSPAVASSW